MCFIKGGVYLQMNNLGNKEILAANLKKYIEASGKDRKDLAEIWGFPYSTVTDWINAKKYPRVDRLQIMADYFGILKSDLTEKPLTNEIKKDNDTIANIIVRMRTDKEFLSVLELLNELDNEKLSSVKHILNAFLK